MIAGKLRGGSAGWLAVGLVLSGLACPSEDEQGPPDPCEGVECEDTGPPCEGVDCSGHGVCEEEDGEAACVCDFTYHADGLACEPDELPALTCEQGWVTHHIDEPATARSTRQARVDTPLRLRSRLVRPDQRDLCGPEPLAGVRLAVIRHASTATAEIEAELAAQGVRRVQPLGGGFQLVDLEDRSGRASVCGDPRITAATPLEASDKIGARLDEHDAGAPVVAVIHELAGASVTVREVTTTAAGARALAAEPAVLAVELRGAALAPVTHVARQAVHTEQVQQADLSAAAPSYSGPVGRGVTLAVVDTGVDADHPDLHTLDEDGQSLGTRVEGDPPYEGDAHGTQVAGIAMGNGVSSDGAQIETTVATPYLWRGHAPQVERVVSVWMNYAPWEEAFIDGDAHLSNHSYIQSDGDYNFSMSRFDGVIRAGAADAEVQRPPRVTLFAAANSGTNANNGAPMLGYYSILAGGKNPICVGGSNANDDTYSTGASAGPTVDGRLKPDLVATGFKQYRPPEGVWMEVDEIRLVAAEGSGVDDRVWGFDTPGDTEGWELGAALLGPVVYDGYLSVTAVGSAGGDDECLTLDLEQTLGGAVSSDLYDRLQISLRLDMAVDPGRHEWPWFWVASWDNTGDGDWNGHLYPGYPDDVQDNQWHVHEVDLSSSGSWNGSISNLRVWPTSYDYRIVMPEVGGGYGRSTGTSLASPVAAGAVAMVMERLVDEHGVDLDTAPPLPSTFKTLLVHTATDLVEEHGLLREPPNPDTGAPITYFEGPDFATGYGLLDAQRLLGLVDAHSDDAAKWTEQPISEGEEHLYAVPVLAAAGGDGLVVTLAWDDAAGSAYLEDTESVLVNDLDLVLVAPDGTAHSPWILDPLPIDADDVWDGIEPIEPADVVPAHRCAQQTYWEGDATLGCEDHLNNLEQVVIDEPVEGWYVLRVRGFDVPEGPQSYSLVVAQECS